MLNLLNGVFYNFLLRFCTITFPHDPTTFDWIPFQMRIQLVLLLDRWKAAVDRRDNIKKYGVEIGYFFPDEEEREILFELMLKKAYQDAEERRQLDEARGVLTPPKPDVEFWQQYCEKEIYEARKAAGEPVFFVNGHCCMDASLYYEYVFCPGPFPGLQYYSCYGEEEGTICILLEMAENRESKFNNYGRNLVCMEENGDHALYGFNRAELLKYDGVIGPATYAERERAYNIYPAELTMGNYKQLAALVENVDLTRSKVLTNSYVSPLYTKQYEHPFAAHTLPMYDVLDVIYNSAPAS